MNKVQSEGLLPGSGGVEVKNSGKSQNNNNRTGPGVIHNLVNSGHKYLNYYEKLQTLPQLKGCLK